MSKACRSATDMSPLVARNTDLDQHVAGLFADPPQHGACGRSVEVSTFLHTGPSLTELLLQKETLTPDEFPALEPIGQHDEVASSIASAA